VKNETIPIKAKKEKSATNEKRMMRMIFFVDIESPPTYFLIKRPVTYKFNYIPRRTITRGRIK
jgi:hypothetical protein